MGRNWEIVPVETTRQERISLTHPFNFSFSRHRERNRWLRIMPRRLLLYACQNIGVDFESIVRWHISSHNLLSRSAYSGDLFGKESKRTDPLKIWMHINDKNSTVWNRRKSRALLRGEEKKDWTLRNSVTETRDAILCPKCDFKALLLASFRLKYQSNVFGAKFVHGERLKVGHFSQFK